MCVLLFLLFITIFMGCMSLFLYVYHLFIVILFFILRVFIILFLPFYVYCLPLLFLLSGGDDGGSGIGSGGSGGGRSVAKGFAYWLQATGRPQREALSRKVKSVIERFFCNSLTHTVLDHVVFNRSAHSVRPSLTFRFE